MAKKGFRQMYYVLDTKDKLKSLGLFTSKQIQERFNIKNSSSVYKLCERNTMLQGQFILVEHQFHSQKKENKHFQQQLFHENERYLYYLTSKFHIVQKSKNTAMEIEFPCPVTKNYRVDGKTYNLQTLYHTYFEKRKGD